MKSITGITTNECQGEALGFIARHSIGTVVTEYRHDKFIWDGILRKEHLMFSFIVEDLSEEQRKWLIERVCSASDLYIVDLNGMP